MIKRKELFYLKYEWKKIIDILFYHLFVNKKLVVK